MTTDIRKFIDNKETLSKIFGSVKISRWVLFVPYYDSKEIVAHAAVKSAEVIAAGLPFIAADFRVAVCQEGDFVIARDKLLNATSDKIEIVAEEVTPEHLSQWATTNDLLADTLERKLRKLPSLNTDKAVTEFKEKVLRWYLDGQSVLEALRKYPLVYERVIKSKAHRESYLVMASMSGNASNAILTGAVKDLYETLQSQAKELHKFSAEKLAYEAVADWLLRCPLDFPEITNV